MKDRKKYASKLLMHLTNKDRYVEEYRNNLEKIEMRSKDYYIGLNEIINNI